MKKFKIRKRMKTDEWNEKSINSEEEETKEEDDDWNKKKDEDKEEGENENDFHEEDYDA
ncbi:MAG: hypothetical protein MUP85_08385 [Candidatus Lokiarchaeota archaeon]|nr:hypothetical protein [Candidatus Lokiarchaeota archaeon]